LWLGVVNWLTRFSAVQSDSDLASLLCEKAYSAPEPVKPTAGWCLASKHKAGPIKLKAMTGFSADG
jgi:hypothetical protein